MDSIKVKICGVQTIEDVELMNKVKPDYIGFVFAESSRKISEQTAEILSKALNPVILKVGVFVNESMEKVIELCEKNIIDIIQLHGDEGEDYIKALRGRVKNQIIRAIRVRSTVDILLGNTIDCDYLLLDAFKEAEYGGSGVSFDWSLIPSMRRSFFLAGGINEENVIKAIERFHPYCIDVSTGVETEGKKDSEKVRKLVQLIRKGNNK